MPREFRAEVGERVNAQGEVLTPLDADAVRAAARRFAAAGIDAVTVCFLHAYRNPAHEQQAARIVAEEMPDAYISLSSEVLPEFREYERLSTTVLNAAVGQMCIRDRLGPVREQTLESPGSTTNRAFAARPRGSGCWAWRWPRCRRAPWRSRRRCTSA